MKVSDQVIETLTGEKTSSVKLLEICNAELLFIENLHKCTDLTILNLRGNFIKEVENIYSLKNLWNLDLAHNELTSVTGLSRFVALGSLNLSFNNLTWKALNDVKHMHICSLQLQGNVEIEKDKNYRTHVVDSLPNVWSLDGKFISAIERLDVANFMTQSELSKHPIRSKLAKHERFQPSYKKDILTYGVFGSKAEELFMNFPTRDNSLVINSEMDRKKLCYLAYNLQEEIEIEKHYAFDVMECEFADKFMEDLLNVRSVEVERSNMLLILILASLEFTLPLHLVQEMLQTAQLDFLGGVNTVVLFEYPRRILVEMASILCGAAKVDRDENRDGGLYPLLYTALDKMLENLTKVANSDRVQYIKRKYKRDPEFMRIRPIVAAEVVQLLCVTPSFYDIADTDAAIQLLLSLALGNDVVMNKTMTLLSRLRTLEGEEEGEGERGAEMERERMSIMEDTAKFIVSNVQLNSQDILNGKQLPSNITKKNSFERPSTSISVKNLQYRPRSGFKQKEYASTLTWLHEKLSPRRRASSAAPPRTEQLSATTFSRSDPMHAGIVGRKVAAVERPSSSAGLYNDILRSSRASGSAAYRPTSGKRTPLPPRMGDVVLLGAQNSGHIISVPDRNTALIMLSEATG
ncbi:uncharacterized protein LOC142353885 [Convolutriloba macropyga]|uniref:uncharacterized protein LOC142353885 n=1 Tax=Convolutriloba macropyga TaxID=536237 RepID=UPI003F525B5F